jgi:heme/copper-type cytochrome/quinol oxidase subunit 1
MDAIDFTIVPYASFVALFGNGGVNGIFCKSIPIDVL